MPSVINKTVSAILKIIIMETLTATNIQSVQEIYAAFGRGDIEFIVAHLDENVNWQIMGAPGVRYAAIYKGQTEVPSFFQKGSGNRLGNVMGV